MIKKNPYEMNIQKKCHVCGQQVLIDQYGNGTPCVTCGWKQNNRGWEFPDRVIYPNLIPLNKAIQLHNAGKPLVPDFEDFIGGLMFYAEMEFWHNGTVYGVYFTNGDIEMFNAETGKSLRYKDKNDFHVNANIDGRKLKDIWHEVKDPYWMS